MRILSLETSTSLGTCALWLDGQILERCCPDGVSHSETLLPLIRALLDEAGLKVSQLDAIAFGAGPGAFTGLRVACATAQGLAISADLPVLPVVSLQALAFPGDAAAVFSVIDARMGEVYAAAYRRNAQGLQLEGEICVAHPSDLPLPEGDWLVRGNALLAYPELAARVAAKGSPAEADAMPRASAVAEIGSRMLVLGQGLDPALAVPVYIRDKVAQTVAERLASGGRA